MFIVRDIPQPFPNSERLLFVSIQTNEATLIILDEPAHPSASKKWLSHAIRL
jgi:hypothetical protein